ncbi:hypothetical protein A2875_03180 [Candidatus Gottesmanbacteria bacterium RIFCSPHIGHO2_01_FULL_46_14]|uniref:Fibronectin type-III domain-containing protein n=1 Tax=Candidatus Gottesmanbacteria bacterium RIFCSPHIGHO2_01_FULL_46_14 TaxID=1798380 RepID=A0A1F5ZR55_9BACT|nr:MAG: hypothetical protein A2875_03180 [Candidatus Gottesmanbacteria bacterium RIFCSPHIGHO2_01_FULL_46_14]
MPQTKIPTIAGLLIAAILVSGIIFFGERVPAMSTLFARTEINAENIKITNSTDVSFSLSWTTQSPVVGDVLVSGGNMSSRTALDDRDTPTKKIPTTTHHVTVRDLTADTQYQLTIRSDGKKAQSPSQSVSTGPSLLPSENNALGPSYGSVLSDTNQPAIGALVYVTVEGGQTLSTFVSPSGSWLIPLNRLRTSDETHYLRTTQRMTENIGVRVAGKEETQAITDTLNDSPVPVMTIGKSYDFRKQQAQVPKQPTVLGTSTVSLVAPQEGSAIPGTTPLIHGTGIPEKTVVLTLGITNPYSDTTIVGTDGIWRYTPIKNLGIGKQSVTMTTQDSSGKTIAITHLFEILKSGTQVLGDATPSATLEPTPTSTLAGEPIPTSGSILPTLIIVFIGFGLLVAGGTLLAL